jgi:hypothetical protein
MSAAPSHAGPHTNWRTTWSCDRRPHGRRGDLPHRRMDNKGVPDSLGTAAPGQESRLMASRPRPQYPARTLTIRLIAEPQL